MKKDSFEYNINEIDMIIERLDKGELSLDESIKEYEKAMKLLKKSSDILNKAEGKIIKVTAEDDSVQLEVEDNA
ncbi:exodeoxyribonuclease VII small subunit [Cetobacterium sp.]